MSVHLWTKWLWVWFQLQSHKISTHPWIRISWKNLKLIKCICSIELKEDLFLSEFSDGFWEIETFNKTHHIKSKENLTPVVTLIWWIPHSWKPKVENELKCMLDLDIIKPVDEPTDWVNGLVIVKNEMENYKFVLTIDLLIKQLNENISTSVPWKSSFLKCREWSTFWK